MYREREARLPGAVVWQRTAAETGTAQRVLPDGCMDVIWVDGALLVAGPDTEARWASGRPDAGYVGLRFAPGTAPAILGLPAPELRNLRVRLADLWPEARVRRLAERLAEAPRPGAVLEEAALRLARDAAPDPALPAIVDLLRAGTPVAAVADTLGVGTRRLHRRCVAAFGYGPKTLERILRMDRAVALVRSGTPLAEVATRAGYADQAHLSREVRALAGAAPGAFTP